MPIPQLNGDGVLPEGIHDCTLEDIRAAFSAAQHSQRRRDLFAELERYVAQLRRWGWVREIHVDGSFVTAKGIPGDIDLAISLRADYVAVAPEDDAEQELLDTERVKRVFGFDIYSFPEDSPIREDVFYVLAHDARTPGIVKGLLRLRL